MCGIAGIYSKSTKLNALKVQSTLDALRHRGPDFQDSLSIDNLTLFHTRLAILDTSTGSNQPMSDDSNRYHLVFNGEIYNYHSIREGLQNKGFSFNTTGDTEVVLKQLIVEGIEGLLAFNGFFSIAFYDQQEDKLLLARDRFGIKPLLYSLQNDNLVFASEMKALRSLIDTPSLDHTALSLYFQLNYIPAPKTIHQGVKKLMPGEYAVYENGQLTIKKYYLEKNHPTSSPSYDEATKKVRQLLGDAIESRMISDVPLGCFLSGGIDSSIIALVAARIKPDLETFSVGFKSNKYFDESEYAELVAKKAMTNHTTIILEEDDLLNEMDNFLASLNVPFADSSALAYYHLSKHTRKKVTVALSGDGADELFGGYTKYQALLRASQQNMSNQLIKKIRPVLNILPNSRSNAFGNKSRQVSKYATGLELSEYDRYWAWCGFTEQDMVEKLLLAPAKKHEIDKLKHHYLTEKNKFNLNEILKSDQSLVLANDMLVKADRMSMANGLEVRVPFLDHHLVHYVRSLPGSYKIEKNIGKRILRDAYKDILPIEIIERPKKGFEVPIESWFNGPLKSRLVSFLEKDLILSQGLFDPKTINNLRLKVEQNKISDVVHLLWALFVFQNYWISNCEKK